MATPGREVVKGAVLGVRVPTRRAVAELAAGPAIRRQPSLTADAPVAVESLVTPRLAERVMIIGSRRGKIFSTIFIAAAMVYRLDKISHWLNAFVGDEAIGFAARRAAKPSEFGFTDYLVSLLIAEIRI